jgi:hypothetical protein
MAGNAPDTRNWVANEMPDLIGRKYKLTVSGEVLLAETGTTAKLAEHHPQGFNPRVLLLDLLVSTSGGVQGHIVRWVNARYEQPTSGDQYDEVDILFDGEIIERVKVGHPKTASAGAKKAGKKRAAKKPPAKKKAATKRAPKKAAANKKTATKRSAKKRRKQR